MSESFVNEGSTEQPLGGSQRHFRCYVRNLCKTLNLAFHHSTLFIWTQVFRRFVIWGFTIWCFLPLLTKQPRIIQTQTIFFKVYISKYCFEMKLISIDITEQILPNNINSVWRKEYYLSHLISKLFAFFLFPVVTFVIKYFNHLFQIVPLRLFDQFSQTWLRVTLCKYC